MNATIIGYIFELLRSSLPALLAELGHDHKDDIADLKAQVAELKAAATAKADK
jgi:hypothetical protein